MFGLRRDFERRRRYLGLRNRQGGGVGIAIVREYQMQLFIPLLGAPACSDPGSSLRVI